MLDGSTVRADEEVVEVHPGDEVTQGLGRGDPEITVTSDRIQPGDQAEASLEDPLGQRLLHGALGTRQVLAEVLEVAAEVEDEEVLLVLARPEQVWAEPGAAADHLPELGLRADHLEEDQVDDLGHVDAGVQHVDADGDVRRLVLGGEVVDQDWAYGVPWVMTRAYWPASSGQPMSKRCAMNSAWAWFLAKMIVLPIRSPPATLCPSVIRVASTLSTVSSLNRNRLSSSAPTSSGGPSSPHSRLSHWSFSSSVRSAYRMPWRRNFVPTATPFGGTR